MYGFWKINKLIWNKNRIVCLIVYWIIIFSTNFLNFSVLLLYEINVPDFCDTSDFFSIFVITRNTEILIKSNYRLGIYVSYIINVWFFCSDSNWIIISIQNFKNSNLTCDYIRTVLVMLIISGLENSRIQIFIPIRLIITIFSPPSRTAILNFWNPSLNL